MLTCGKKRLKLRPKSLVVKSEIFIFCYIGVPNPTIQWFKDEAELKNKPGLQVSTAGKNTFVSIQKSAESDSGRYSCVATNKAGKATSMAEVKVKRE